MSSIDLGAAIYIAIKPILKIYSIIFVGYLLARYNIVTTEIARGISNMVVNAILPCLTFNKIVTNLSWHDIKEIGVIVLSAIVLFAVGTALSLLTNYVAKTPKEWFWGLVFAGLFPNISDLPIAYVQSMDNGTVFTEDESNKGVAYSCIFLTVQSFLMMNFGLWRLVGYDFEKADDDSDSIPDDSDRVANNNIKDKNDDYMETTSEIIKNKELNERLDENLPNKTLHDEQSAMDNTISHGQETFDTVPESLRSIDSLYSSEFLNNEADSAHDNVSRVESLQLFIPEAAHKRIPSTSTMSDVFKTFSDPLFGGSSAYDQPSRIDGQVFQNNTNLKQMHTFSSIPSYMSVGSLRKRRTSKTRSRKPSINDVIEEYSAVDRIKTGELDLSKPLTLTEDIGTSNVNIVRADVKMHDLESAYQKDDDSQIHSFEEIKNGVHNVPSNVETENSSDAEHYAIKGSLKIRVNNFIREHKLEWLVYIAINFCRPASLGALLGIICALVPYLKALFVITYVHVHLAPDGEPVLNFLMDFTAYIGNACIPLGLLMLGGTLARLEIKSLPKGFMKTAVMLTALKLALTPVIGVAWTNKLADLNWLENRIGRFVMILTFSMPSATAQVYFTAFYTPVGPKHVQMDCLSVFFLMQYCVLFISLSIVLTYALKVNLGV
ncbi:hypothetical protein TPHA_0A01360 [Tetrapisispora phaffii CBS 4417]|uniref:Auxin efflux carrier component n=1 Tax=Tetrapisispora phaffii (strain ATCC 24235 / CBS 4417 / NBRC 1672 / NRRL Y-8282 / UCD 70-5) TaxID=1071381 RepID=G8BMU1_TETPH|nr:hypothetical protein TPHA_0A01360 [Tetrapisispora phaffii CBS 4417]CCE61219.1 hypothetical protein TPHA_0A01360 [Tetrapisispora phaffii CBS 4417]